MKNLYWKAHAKINLSLDVLSKRPDGYHNLSTIMQSLELHDTLYIAKRKEPGIILRTNTPFLPTDSRNLVYKAAERFLDVAGINDIGVEIELDKRIPIAAGLAGGSSDAASTLLALNKLFATNLPMNTLEDIAASLGSDIPFCLHGGTCLATGRGEVLTPLNPFPHYYCVLVKPDFDVSTRMIYENLSLSNDLKHPDTNSMLAAISASDFDKALEFTGNLLENVTCGLHPEISDIKNMMLQYGATTSLMCGSGPTVFGIFKKRRDAENAYHKFKNSIYSKHVYFTLISRPKK